MHANPQGQRPDDVGDDLPEPSESDENKKDKSKHESKDKKEPDKNDGTAHHKPGRM